MTIPYRLAPFAGLELRLKVMNSVSTFGNMHRVHTITNLAALKHFGGPNYPAANDNIHAASSPPPRRA